jgi:hypothetical protein
MIATIPISASFKNEFSFVDRWVYSFPFRSIVYKLVESFYKWSLNRLLQHLHSALLLIKGAQSIVENYDKPTASSELRIVNEAIGKFINLESKFASIDYFGSADVKSLMNSCISSLYEVEFLLRRKAFEGEAIKKTDLAFKRALAEKSKIAIIESLAN